MKLVGLLGLCACVAACANGNEEGDSAGPSDSSIVAQSGQSVGASSGADEDVAPGSSGGASGGSGSVASGSAVGGSGSPSETGAASGFSGAPSESGSEAPQDASQTSTDTGAPSQCTTAARACSNMTPETCVGGQWVLADAACAGADPVCANGSCVACAASTSRCAGATAEVCSGGSWADAEACPYVCENGGCTGVCVPSSTGCADATHMETCGSNGQWGTAVACNGTCSMGACVGLPFPVDVIYMTTGYEGDASQGVVQHGDATGTACGTRAQATGNVGNCWSVAYTPVAGGAGWAAVEWQYPTDNWGTMPGYVIPAGATKVTFWARGMAGGEAVTFGVGQLNTTSVADPYKDAVVVTPAVTTLTATWTKYTINLPAGSYATGQIIAFNWTVTPAPKAAITFFVDDIEWSM